jgi:DNA-binding CsgD family transcriptional regulator
MASKTVIQQRRESVAEMLEDALPIRAIAKAWGITPETVNKDWHVIEEGYRKQKGYDEELTPHTIYRLALCTKIFLLSLLGYSQLSIARLLNVSQGHVSRLKRWSEHEGIYSKTCIVISVNERVRTVDGEREVQPGEYCVWSMNDNNCWLSKEGVPSYIVSFADLLDNHTLISVRKRECDRKNEQEMWAGLLA